MALGGDTSVSWVCDVEPGPCRLAEVRWPGVPNLGDITQVDWSEVEPVDVIVGGSPCQDLSLAGRRAGMASGTRSGLWDSMRVAIETIRPQLVVWENVVGALSGEARCNMERVPGLLGAGSDGPVLRAAGRVCGDLAGLGYDSRWEVVRACDVGAPHRRARVFLVAHPHGQPWGQPGGSVSGSAPFGRAYGLACRRDRASGPLMSTRLLPTPQATNSTYSGSGYGANLHEVVVREMSLGRFGEYAQAVELWEWVLGRRAPAPTKAARRQGGKPRLSEEFVEFLMGVPEGHVTGGDLQLTREQELRLLGNGVVSIQAAVGIFRLLQAGQGVGA